MAWPNWDAAPIARDTCDCRRTAALSAALAVAAWSDAAAVRYVLLKAASSVDLVTTWQESEGGKEMTVRERERERERERQRQRQRDR